MQFQDLLKALADCGVEFLVIGGVAIAAHGSAYQTRDLDICYQRSPENCDRLVKALSPLHPYLRNAPRGIPFLFDRKTLLSGMNFTLGSDLGDIDLLGEVTGGGKYEQLFSDSVKFTTQRISINVISLEALIQTKRAADRQKDRLVLPELEALLEIKKKLGES